MLGKTNSRQVVTNFPARGLITNQVFLWLPKTMDTLLARKNKPYSDGISIVARQARVVS